MEEFHIDPELRSSLDEASEEDLQALAELHEDPANDDQIELYIYLCFLIFRKSHNKQYLERAIQRAEGWAAVTAASNPDHDRRYSILNTVIVRGNQYRAIAGGIEAVLTPVDSHREGLATNEANIQSHLNSEAIRLIESFQQTGRYEDLNKAIESMELATSVAWDYITPDMLNNFGGLLGMRFERTGSIDDLNRAVNVANEAVDATPHDHPDRAAYLNSHGGLLGRRFERTGSIDDLNRQLSSYIASWHCATAPPGQRIQSAQKAADILISQLDWEQSYQLLQEAVSLLPTVSPRFLNRTDAQALLAGFFGLASSAAAAALSAGKAPEDALRLLELGRGVIASLLMDMRGDLSDLQQDYPIIYATSLISTDKVSSWELQSKRRRDADREFNEVVHTIRAQPGFSNFLQQPAAEELINAANQGPIIVVNISSFRCDAFLIQRRSIQVVELPGIMQKELIEQVDTIQTKSDLLSSLEWLWHNICHPCLNALGIKDTILDDNWPHIWWIPTGLLSRLPLHGAGIYKHASKETVLDRAVSSYASSIKALLHGRKQGVRKPNLPSLEVSALMVAMSETPGLGERGRLEFASEEVHMLKQLCPQLYLAPTEPSRQKDEILKHLSMCKIFHFAGHGKSDPRDPSRSCLLLDDWETNPLTVEEVRDSRLQDNPPFLAYLSACSTGANKAATLADEGIHLISAFQLAGFRHVVGTLWEVIDEQCVDAAKILYQTLQKEGITDEAVSRGLHQAVRALRNKSIRNDRRARDVELLYPDMLEENMIDYSWVPYIHFGV